jgi:hypothetical protein
MIPVFQGMAQIKTRMLQTIVNIRHFDSLNSDQPIRVSYVPLLVEAKLELFFWKGFILAKNSRVFAHLPPALIAWSDASDMAIGGFVAELEGDINLRSFTADNWLLSADQSLEKFCHGVQLHVDTLPWSQKEKFVTRSPADLDPLGVKRVFICHRNLDFAERATDSNERELLAALHVLISCLPVLKGKTITLHMDNINAVAICSKGSPKPRLQAYAKLIAQICIDNDICLQTVWIPRDINNVADFISKEIDFHDYSVSTIFFNTVCKDMCCRPKVDLFADNRNAQILHFFSTSFCPGTMGVDAFCYNWSLFGLAWIFVSPKLILRALNYLEICKSEALILVPQWKTSHFYPALMAFRNTRYLRKKIVYNGAGIFVQGSDSSSFFGPAYTGNVEVWHLNFCC